MSLLIAIVITNKNQSICKSNTTISCVKKVRDYFDKSNNITTECEKYCPLECESISYSLSINSATYPTQYYWDVIKKQANLISKSVTKNEFSFNEPVNPQNGNTPPPVIVTSGSMISPSQNNNITATSTTPGASTKLNSDQTSPMPMPDQFAGDHMKENILMLSFYYQDLKYTYIEESPYMDLLTFFGVLGIFNFYLVLGEKKKLKKSGCKN